VLNGPARAVAALLELGAARAAILTLGDQGLWLAEAGHQQHLPAFAVRAVDTTAAGDAFLGGFAAALARGQDSVAACRYGAAAGALAVTRPGAQPSLPTRDEVEDFLAQRGI